MGCLRSSRCPPQGHLLTSQAQTQNSLDSGHRSLCRSPGKICFPLACIPCVCRMDIQHSVLFSFYPAVTKLPLDASNARWLPYQRLEDAKPHTLNLPVSIWSNLLHSRLSACQEFLRIGHIKEVILHVNRWGWVLPRLKHLAVFR